MHEKRILKTPAGETTINVPSPGDFRSFYVFAMHKSGSTLLNKMLDTAFMRAGVPQIAIPELTFAAGLPDDPILNPEDFLFDNGYCYRGFRIFPSYLRYFDITKNKKILLVRDPRDMIVSYYFSMSQSHMIPDSGPLRDELMSKRDTIKKVSVDDFCLKHFDILQKEFKSYRTVFGSQLRVYRYEDVIFNKLNWLKDMLWYLGFALSSDDRKRIAEENDIRPTIERPHEHIRQVTPGNYRKHLSKTTIKRLNFEFRDMLDQFDYGDRPRTAGNGSTKGFGAPHYVLGDELAFAVNRTGGTFLRSGFSDPEPWGIWTVEPKAAIAVPIEKAAAFSLWLQFQTFARTAGPPAGFVVEVHGQQVGSFSVQSGQWGEVYERTFEIPESLVSGPVLEIDLKIENGPTPAELRPNQRPVGIGLHRMRLSAA
jgi:Sulfotransferase domain